MEELAAGLINPLVSMRAEVIPLGLQQVRRQTLGAVTVVVCQGRAERRNGNTILHCLLDRPSPAALGLAGCGLEEGRQQQVDQLFLAVECVLDVSKELAADNATAAPHKGDLAVVKLPVIFLGRLAQKLIALCVGADLRCVKCLLEVIDELGLVALE